MIAPRPLTAWLDHGWATFALPLKAAATIAAGAAATGPATDIPLFAECSID